MGEKILMIRNLNIKKLVFELILLFLVFFTLFVPNKYSKEVLAGVILVYSVISFILFKKASIFSADSRKVSIQLLVLAVIYVAINYLVGIYSGFYKNPIITNVSVQIKHIVLSTIIVIASEIVRYIFISKKEKLSLVLVLISLVIVDIILYAQMYDITRLDDFLALLRLGNICIGC